MSKEPFLFENDGQIHELCVVSGRGDAEPATEVDIIEALKASSPDRLLRILQAVEAGSTLSR